MSERSPPPLVSCSPCRWPRGTRARACGREGRSPCPRSPSTRPPAEGPAHLQSTLLYRRRVGHSAMKNPMYISDNAVYKFVFLLRFCSYYFESAYYPNPIVIKNMKLFVFLKLKFFSQYCRRQYRQCRYCTISDHCI